MMKVSDNMHDMNEEETPHKISSEKCQYIADRIQETTF